MIISLFADGFIVEEWFLTDLAEQLLLAKKAGLTGSLSKVARQR